MEKDIASWQIGSEGSVKIDFKDGKLRLIAAYDGHEADASMMFAFDAEKGLDSLDKKIGNPIVSGGIQFIKGLLKGA